MAPGVNPLLRWTPRSEATGTYHVLIIVIICFSLKALEDRISEVQLIEDKAKLRELNTDLAEKIHSQQEELIKYQAQLQDARDQSDLLEFRVLELEEENEKVSVLLTYNKEKINIGHRDIHNDNTKVP